MLRSLPVLLSAILLSGGCAVKSTVKLVQASQAVDRAAERGAAEDAAYEYTLATHYLDKAREEAGDGHHRLAQDLADTAAGHADQAVIRIQEGGGTPTPTAGGQATEPRPAARDEPAPGPDADRPDEGSAPEQGDEASDDEAPPQPDPVGGDWTPPPEAPPEDAP